MKLVLLLVLVAAAFAPAPAQSDMPSSPDAPRVTTANGVVEGFTAAGGVRTFRGIPYAAPPVRDLRWRPPQPPADWEGVRPADRFGPQCMQKFIFDDMVFRSDGTREDCLYLNVWTPDAAPDAALPVLVYFYGGGFLAGDGSEFRYDGASMAERGIVVVTLNYRLGVFGFLAHPALTAESPHGASGNYGLLDQAAALTWVRDNIAAFGGDPDRVTIAGESAGSISVSAQMASPLAKDLIAGAIGESGSLLGTLPAVPLAEAEAVGAAFAERIGAESLGDLRALSSTRLLELASQPGVPRFPLAVDGYFFAEPPLETYAAGEQAAVPLLLGWNSEEMNYRFLLGPAEPTPEDYERMIRERFGDRADEVLALYPGTTQDEVIQSATDLAGDQFIGYSTWKWFDLHRQTDAPVYRYYYVHPRPPAVAEDAPPPAAGAVHSAEIEYALGNLATNEVYAWTDEDYAVSEVMQGYFANFIKTGDPNGTDLPTWPAAERGEEPSMMMALDVESEAVPASNRTRYLLLDELSGQ